MNISKRTQALRAVADSMTEVRGANPHDVCTHQLLDDKEAQSLFLSLLEELGGGRRPRLKMIENPGLPGIFLRALFQAAPDQVGTSRWMSEAQLEAAIPGERGLRASPGPVLSYLKGRLEQKLGLPHNTFTGVVVNLLRDEEDHINCHYDGAQILEDFVAVLVLCPTSLVDRKVVFWDAVLEEDGTIAHVPSKQIHPKSGEVYYLTGYPAHSVPPLDEPCGARISITFVRARESSSTYCNFMLNTSGLEVLEDMVNAMEEGNRVGRLLDIPVLRDKEGACLLAWKALARGDTQWAIQLPDLSTMPGKGLLDTYGYARDQAKFFFDAFTQLPSELREEVLKNTQAREALLAHGVYTPPEDPVDQEEADETSQLLVDIATALPPDLLARAQKNEAIQTLLRNIEGGEG